jgi:hypothetical protein
LVDPSFKAMKELFLNVRTQPFTVNVCPVAAPASISLILTRDPIHLIFWWTKIIIPAEVAQVQR